MKKIPLTNYDFEELINNDFLYIDKTKTILKMIDDGKNYFLSRPRRWGKTITISVLKSLFLGKRNLFKGTYAYDNYKEWNNNYPTVVISFAGYDISYNNTIGNYLQEKTSIYVEDKKYTIKDFLSGELTDLGELIKTLYKKFNKPVVILIDEYDSPFTKNLGDEEEFLKIKRFFSKFYHQIKDFPSEIRFFYLSGLTKVAQTSIFSTMNNLDDITFDINYYDIVGYTLKDIKTYFKENIKELCKFHKVSEDTLLKRIKEHYDGYFFGMKGDNLYNTLSINAFFKKKEFKSYWAETGDTNLINKVLNKLTLDEYLQFIKDIDEKKKYGEAQTVNLEDIKTVSLHAILVGAGYLTYDGNKVVFPNKEAREELLKHFLNIVINANNKDISQLISIRDGLYEGIIEGNAGKCEMALNKIKRFKDDPSDWTAKNPEGVMKSIISLFLDIAPFENLTKEEGHDGGKTDIVLYHRGKHYIIEAKIAKTNDDKSAIEQIDKQYLSSFQGKEGYKIGITLYPKREENKISVVMEKL